MIQIDRTQLIQIYPGAAKARVKQVEAILESGILAEMGVLKMVNGGGDEKWKMARKSKSD